MGTKTSIYNMFFKKCFVIFCVCFSIVVGAVIIKEPVPASASAWTNNADQSIYGGDSSSNTDVESSSSSSKPGTIEKIFIELIKPIVDSLNGILKELNLDLNSIVFGRVGGNGYITESGNRISLLTFELTQGNPYGIIAVSVYSILRSIAYILMTVLIFARVVSSAYSGNGGKAKEVLKETIKGCLVGFALLTVMPYFMDVLLYLRDTILYAVGVEGASALLGTTAGMTITDVFKEIASDSLLNTFMYAGTIALALYFAAQYAGVALSMVISFVAFPFVCINAQMDKHAFGTWAKNVLGYVLVPIMDSILLLIPASMSIIAAGSNSTSIAVIQLFVCGMLIPARQTIRSVLGLQPRMGMESAGLGMVMSGAMFAKAAVGNTVGAVADGIKGYREGNEDARLGDMYDELANAEGNNSKSAQYGTASASYQANAGSMGTQMSGNSSMYEKDMGTAETPTESELGTVNSSVEGSDGLSESGVIEEESNLVSSGNTSNSSGQKSQDILDRYANVNNFDNPIFGGISNRRRAELYRERANKKRREAITNTVGRVLGATAMGTVGASFGTMMGGKTMAMGAALGMEAGGRAGAKVMTTSVNGGMMAANSLAGIKSNALKESAMNVPLDSVETYSDANGMTNGIDLNSDSYIVKSDQGYACLPTESVQNEIIDSYAQNEQEYNSFLSDNQDVIYEVMQDAADYNNSTEKTQQLDQVYYSIKETEMSQKDKETAMGKAVETIAKANYAEQLMNSPKFKKSGNQKKDQAFIIRSANEQFAEKCKFVGNRTPQTKPGEITTEDLQNFGWDYREANKGI